MYVTRSGRQIKKPDRYVPIEKVEDDFGSDEYDSNTDAESDSGSETGSESSANSEEVDEHGNLRDFVEYSDSEDEEA